MKQNPFDSILRWRDSSPGGESDEDRASALARDSLLPGAFTIGLDDRQLARIEQNLKTSRRTRSLLGLRLALVALLLVASVASVMAFQSGWFAPPASKDGARPTPVKHEPRKAPRVGMAPVSAETARLVEESPDIPGTTDVPATENSRPRDLPPVIPQKPATRNPELAQVPAFPAPAAATTRAWTKPQVKHEGNNETPVRTTASAEASSHLAKTSPSLLPSMDVPATESSLEPAQVLPVQPAATAPAAESSLARQPATITRRDPEPARSSEEVLALDHAMRLLRGNHDAQAALMALDDYFTRFPRGVLGHEARVARVDALLMLKRPDEALRALEALPLDEHRRSTELQLIRAELRARSDCALAESDYTAVLARVRTAVLEERALYGRASCRSKHGDVKGAAEDLHRYLHRFPKGSHAGWARRWLENTNN
jgi:hypothetical protein